VMDFGEERTTGCGCLYAKYLGRTAEKGFQVILIGERPFFKIWCCFDSKYKFETLRQRVYDGARGQTLER